MAKEILCEFMEQFHKRKPNLFVFSSHLHMDEQTPHIHIGFVSFIRNSKRGLDTRVSLKGALASGLHICFPKNRQPCGEAGSQNWN